jgi:hypothetical protein
MYLRFNVDVLTVDEVTASEYLAFKEHLADGACLVGWGGVGGGMGR